MQDLCICSCIIVIVIAILINHVFLSICFWAQRVWHSNCLKAANEAANERASRKEANEAVNEAAKKKQSANVYLLKHAMLDLKV